MEKHYEQREIRDLHDLHREQIRIRHAYKNLESDWAGSLTSSNTIFSLLSYLFFQKYKKKKKGWSNITRMDRKKDNLQDTSNKNKSKGFPKSYKKLGRTVLLWEATALFAFIGGNIAVHYLKKRSGKK